MSKPNFVFIIADQHRWDFVGYETGNGSTHTPNLDRLAEQGTVFHRAYTTAPLCCPARAALALGRYAMNSGCYTNLQEPDAGSPTFVSQLRGAGYQTSVVGKTHMEIHAYDSNLEGHRHMQLMRALGWEEVREISGNGMCYTGIRDAYTTFLKEGGHFDDVLDFYSYWGYFLDPVPKTPAAQHQLWELDEALHETAFVGQGALDWLAGRDTSRPFFLHVGFAGPHSPIEPLPRLFEMYAQDEETSPWGCPDGYPDWLPAWRRGYRAMITEVDEWVGRIHDRVDAMGELENTVFVYVADHGDMAGDFGRLGKTCFYEASTHVPLIVAGPGVRSGDSDALVEHLDLGATVCDLAGVPTHTLDQGRSLAPVLSGQSAAHRETVYSEMGADRMLFDGRHKLMWGDPGSDSRKLGRLHLDKPVTIPASPCRLYDLQEDPHEENDLSGDAALRAAMLEKLLARLNENAQPGPAMSRGAYRPLR